MTISAAWARADLRPRQNTIPSSNTSWRLPVPWTGTRCAAVSLKRSRGRKRERPPGSSRFPRDAAPLPMIKDLAMEISNFKDMYIAELQELVSVEEQLAE